MGQKRINLFYSSCHTFGQRNHDGFRIITSLRLVLCNCYLRINRVHRDDALTPWRHKFRAPLLQTLVFKRGLRCKGWRILLNEREDMRQWLAFHRQDMLEKVLNLARPRCNAVVMSVGKQYLEVWPPLRRRFCATVCLAKNTFGFHFFNDVVHERLSRLDRSEITNNQCHKFPGNTQTDNGSVHLITQSLAQFEADRKLVVKARFLLPASYSLTAVQILEGQNGGWLTASWR